jgi:hypothetical protein
MSCYADDQGQLWLPLIFAYFAEFKFSSIFFKHPIVVSHS